MNFKNLKMLTVTLALTLTLAGCSALGDIFGGAPAVIAPSTFCQGYKPVRAQYDDPSALPGTEAHKIWWDALEKKVGKENSARIRGANIGWSSCPDEIKIADDLAEIER